MSILASSTIIRRLLKLQSGLVFEVYDSTTHGPEAVLAQLDRICSDADKAKAMGPHFCEVLRQAKASRRSQGSSSTEDHVAEWIERTMPSGFFLSTVSAIPGEPPNQYAKRVRGALHALARSLGIHFQFVVVAAWQPKMRRSHAHCIVAVPNVVDGPYSLVSMAIHMVGHLPDGEVAIYPRVPYGGDATYVIDHLESERGMETLTVDVACPRRDADCCGRCVVTREDPQFTEGARYRRDYVPVPVVGVIRDGVFTPRARRMNKETTKRLTAQKKAARETARGIRDLQRETDALARAARSLAKASKAKLGSTGEKCATAPRRRRKPVASAGSFLPDSETSTTALPNVRDRAAGPGEDFADVRRSSSRSGSVPVFRRGRAR